MASADRPSTTALSRLKALAADPTRFNFQRAMRILDAAFPGRPRLGESKRPKEDAVRLGQEVSLAFPTSTIAAFKEGDEGKPARLTTRFFGVFGPNGPLPLHLTEYARERQRHHRDDTLIAFTNIFHHRFLSLFWRAWSAADPAASFDRPDSDHFSDDVAAIAGYRGQALANRDEMPDLAKRRFAGRLAHHTRSEDGLLAIVSSFFNAPVEIQPFIGSWLRLEPEEHWRLGDRGVNARLGQSTSLGARVWTRQDKFRIRIGPMSVEEYERLLPGGDSLKRLVAIVRNYIGDELDWDVNLVLKEIETPPAQLGKAGQLGWTTWIGQRQKQDAYDLYLSPLTSDKVTYG